jgi:GT2 family glycosyltransferase
MQPRVIAVVVARNGAHYLPRTLAALAAQTRRPDAVILVDAGSNDSSAELMTGAGSVVRTRGRASFGSAVDYGLTVAAPKPFADEWLWLLGHDNAPEPGALSALLGAVEIAPSVAVAGPKLMKSDSPHVIAEFGETLTRFGRSIALAIDELDQAQHDLHSDRLGVAAAGMLVQREAWTALGGFDPGLPTADAGLDLSIRARLAGHRVIGVPNARVASAGPSEQFGRRSISAAASARIRRAAQLHRRLVYAPAAAVVLHWLSLVPLGLLRALGHVIARRPRFAAGEIGAAFAAAFDGTVPAARARLARTRRLGWASLAPLRLTWSQVRELQAAASASATPDSTATRVGFFSAGGAWIVLVAAIASAVLFGRFFGVAALTGGTMLPLSSTVGQLWSHVGYGWHDLGSGFVGAADPFTYVLAVLGTITFWSPSSSIVALSLAALPLAALTAWFCAARFSTRALPPAIAAIAWCLAPPFLTALGGGQFGAVIVHILLPVLLLAVVGATRSWPQSAAAAVLFATVAASSPSLIPALVIAWFAWLIANPRAVLRISGIPLPALALFAPLAFQQGQRGNWLAIAADPGAPSLTSPSSGLGLASGSPVPGANGFEGFLGVLGIHSAVAPVIVAVLLAPLAILAVLALVLPGSRRAIPALFIALLGFVTAVAASHLQLSFVGATATPVWAGAGLSLYWLGLVGASVIALTALGTSAILPGVLVAAGLAIAAVPLLGAIVTGSTAVTASTGRLLPAFATAAAAADPGLGTLELTPRPGGISVTIDRGIGTTLDEQSTLAATDAVLDDGDNRVAELAGNLSSRSGFDVASELNALHIGFVLVPQSGNPDAATSAVRQRVVDALDGNRSLTSIGNTANGALWHFDGLSAGAAPSGPGPTGTRLGVLILVGQGLVFFVTLLLAIPTSRRRTSRSRPAAAAPDDLEPEVSDE